MNRTKFTEPPMLEQPVEADQGAVSHSIEQLIEMWWADHFPGSAVARDTLAWNVAHAAKENLKRLLKGSN